MPMIIKPLKLLIVDIFVLRGSRKSSSTEVAFCGNEIRRAPSLSGRVGNVPASLVAVQCG